MRQDRRLLRQLRRDAAKRRRSCRAQRQATKPAVSPLAPERFPALPEIAGLRLAAHAAGVRYTGRADVMLAVLGPGTTVAGVTTRSATRSASVLDCEDKLHHPKHAEEGAAILVNSGNANAFTGGAGIDSVSAICRAVAQATGVPQQRVFTSSTGVIGEKLPHDRIVDALDELVAALREDGLARAASAIMTTDTFPKGASADVDVDGRRVRIAGIAKGSGMIAPDMATMLVYVFTDAAVEQALLQEMVRSGSDASFNRITVDSDTSTSDTVLVAATGQSGVAITAGSPGERPFRAALDRVLLDLAHLVVRDGEGATKFVEVHVTGAETEEDAERAARAVADSPLVKTALAGEDPNWGRIVMAIGKSGASADRDRLSIRFGDILVAENGWVAASYREAQGAAYMKGQDIVIGIDLGLGASEARVWTCDLTHGYITINSDYRS